MSVRKHLLALLIPCLAAPACALADPSYTITFLPAGFDASAINNLGHVVGNAGDGAAIWNGSSVFSLGTLLPGSEGLAINNLDQIAGRNTDGQSFYYAGGAVHNITSGFEPNWATGINDSGQVSGTSGGLFGGQAGFLYAGGAFTPVTSSSTFVTGTFANAINGGGMVAGTAVFDSGAWANPDRNAFVWNGTDVRTLGSLGGQVSEAYDLNDAGAVVGWSSNFDGSEELGFVWTGDFGMLNIGSLGGHSTRAAGINNAGLVVGMSDIGGSDFFNYHAFLYDGHSMVDLNSLIDPASGWVLVSARDINDAGQILARACHGGADNCMDVRLDLVSAVPEPATWSMLLGGLALVGAARLRRRGRLLALPLLAGPLAAHAALPNYTATSAPAGFYAEAINNAGDIVGTGPAGVAVWSGASLVPYDAIIHNGNGFGISNRGYLVGAANGSAFLYKPGSLRDIGRLNLLGSSFGIAVNDAGQAAGSAYWGVGERIRGWVYSNGVVRMIGSFGGDWSVATAINSAGQVVGNASLTADHLSHNVTHAYLYRDRVMRDLGTLGGASSGANDINNAGQVAGWSELLALPDEDTPHHAFLYQAGSMADLGTLGGSASEANGINNLGIVVGWAFIAGDEPHAFVAEGGVMTDLNSLVTLTPGWVVTEARDINDSLQILARACNMEDCVQLRLDPVPMPVGAPAVAAGAHQ
jgi:probable HAF family extracellular repeat protein